MGSPILIFPGPKWGPWLDPEAAGTLPEVSSENGIPGNVTAVLLSRCSVEEVHVGLPGPGRRIGYGAEAATIPALLDPVFLSLCPVPPPPPTLRMLLVS